MEAVATGLFVGVLFGFVLQGMQSFLRIISS